MRARVLLKAGKIEEAKRELEALAASGKTAPFTADVAAKALKSL